MTTDDASFGPVVSAPSSFNMMFQHDKDMSTLQCVDLFPNPPRQIDDNSQDPEDPIDGASTESLATDLNPTLSDNSNSCNEEKSIDHMIINHSSPKDESSNLPDDNEDTAIANSAEIQNDEHSSYDQVYEDENAINSAPVITNVEPSNTSEDRKSPNKLQFPLPVVSPALSISSHYSSAESVSSATSVSKKKKKKRTCVTCGLKFPHKIDLLEHLKIHVGQPTIHLENLPDDNVHLQDYRDRQTSISDTEATDEEGRTNGTHEVTHVPHQIESGGLKLKLKLSASQNFEVVPMNQTSQNFEVVPLNQTSQKNQPATKSPTIRVLSAQEVKKSMSPTPDISRRNGPLDAMISLTQSAKQLASDNASLLENKYFECPTLDGLDQFAEEINNEAAEDLLKKLLEGGQHVQQEHDWTSSNTNEFISIDRLANMCPVCNANFPDALRLYDHKRITGHDFQHPMQPPPPPSNMSNIHMTGNHRLRPPFQSHYPGPMPNGPTMSQNCGPTDNIRPPTFPMYHPHQSHPRFIAGPNFNQPPQARRPPPLYRVPTPHSAHPINMAPFAEMNPEMYIPSTNGHNMMNGGFHPNQPPHIERQPVFLKARLQRPAQRPRTPGMYERSPNATPSPPVILSQQTVTRPRFLGPPTPTQIQGPPIKKIKQEPSGADDCEIVSTQPRGDGLPVIQSVQGGASIAAQPLGFERSKDPIQLNDQITLSIKNKEQSKNPKEVANILANRGITVTHKPKPPNSIPSREGSPKNITQEAVQKLQLNNSVSIISKKKPESAEEVVGRPRTGDSAFISCPVIDCEEKFLTQEGLNRHTQRGHRMGKVGLKPFRCKFCPALFSTQEGLTDHQRKAHRIMKTSADEVGIPIIDLRNEETKRKLAQLGIVNYIPVNAKATNSCFGFPIVSVQGAANPNICNMQGMGVSSLLSLGPIKQIPFRKFD